MRQLFYKFASACLIIGVIITIIPNKYVIVKNFSSKANWQKPIPDSTEKKYILKVKKSSKEKFQKLDKITQIREKDQDWTLVKAHSEEELTKIKKEFDVLAVYPDLKRQIMAPNDSYYNSQNTIFSGQYDQWNLHLSGFTPTSDPNSGWNISTGSSDTIIAVIDTGLGLTNPDIVNGSGGTWGDNNIWINQGEIPTAIFNAIDSNTNGVVESRELINYFVTNNFDIDADGKIDYLDIIANGSPIINGIDDNTPPNGYIDDIFGYNFADLNQDINDVHGHGTHVSGIIGATTNNNSIVNPGIAGICWACKIMPLKVINSHGFGYDSDIVEAINYAIVHGAKVINISIGGPGYSQPLQDAITNAWNNGVLVVSAAGNNASSASDIYPGGASNSISVGSLTHQNQKAWYSNIGGKLDIMAYGDNVLSTYHLHVTHGCVGAGNYVCLSGTSMASPHVAGLAALIFDLHKNDTPPWTAREVRNALIKNAIDMNTVGFDDQTGFGRINAKAALEATVIAPDTINPVAALTGLSNTYNRGTFNILGTASDENMYLYMISFQRQYDNYIIKQYAGRNSITSSTLMSIDSSIIPDGVYNVILRVEDFYGNVTTATATNVIIDNTQPSAFSLITPSNTSASTQPRPSFTWSEATDFSPVTYDFYFNGNLQSSNLASTNFTPSSDLAEGTYIWNVVAKDAAGNTTHSGNFTFYADRSPPNPFSINISINTNSPTISFATTDSISGVQAYQASINGSPFVGVSSPYNPGPLADGNYTVTIRAIDKAGNNRDSSTNFVINSVCVTRKTKADFNCDGVVNLSDLSILAANWNKSNTADATGDGITNLSDLSILAANWNKNV